LLLDLQKSIAFFENYQFSPACPSDNSSINPLMPELNPSTQRCLARFFTGDFAS
jgi:hypothetical protein